MSLAAVTLVVAVNNREILESNLLRSPLLAKGHPHQLLIREGFRSAALAYNDALEEATHEVVVFLHQDIYLPDHWLGDLEQTLNALKAAGRPWGVIGCFGARAGAQGGLGSVYSTGWGIQGRKINEPAEVETLDEIVLVVCKSSGLRFDPLLPYYHMYGVDLCLTARSLGLPSYVMPTFCIHNTRQVLVLPPEFFSCYSYVKNKWPQYLPINSSCITISRFDAQVIRRRVEALLAPLRRKQATGAQRLEDPRALLPSALTRMPLKDYR